MPKATVNRAAKQQRHNPLADDLVATGPLRTKPSKRKSRHDGKEEENYVGAQATQKILRMGHELEEEDQAQNLSANTTERPNKAFDLDSRFMDEDEEDDDAAHGEEAWGNEEEVEEVEVSPEELETFKMFNSTPEDPLLRNGWDGPSDEVEDEGRDSMWLSNMILEKIAIAEKDAQHVRGGGHNDRMSDAGDDDYQIPPKAVEVYGKIGLLLSRYKSGKLPKAFKILPTIPHWERIIELTRPEEWTPNAVYAATVIFISGEPATAKKFMELIMLPAVQDNIHETQKLDVHLFDALKRSLFKPAAFFKGFLFPLVREGCSLRAARIISGVLVRVSIPLMHSAAAIKFLCDIAAQEATVGNEAGGAINIFIKAFLDKKYALPFQVIDALVFHFLRFRTVDSTKTDAMQGVVGLTQKQAKEVQLPVIWHQCFLAFAERYRDNISEDQREALLDLLLTKGHSKIGPAIRRELLAGRGMGVQVEDVKVLDGDDTMMMD